MTYMMALELPCSVVFHLIGYHCTDGFLYSYKAGAFLWSLHVFPALCQFPLGTPGSSHRPKSCMLA